MNTTKLKPFAQQARKILMEGVRLRMLYWGFDEKNGITAEPEAVPGGVIFRNEIYNDIALTNKWNQLKKSISNHSYKDAVEEAAYTWFNRLMAIKILEKNGYEDPHLQYTVTVPALLEKARNGLMPFLNDADKQKVRDKILAGDEEAAFGILLVGYCRKHQLLNRVFGGIDDFTELLLPNNLLSAGGIIELLNKNGFVEDADYKEVELIGWLYQFYISERKDEVFKGFKENKKARKEDIPAATQIFTPKWIVRYMVENTVGKVWLDYQPTSALRGQMKYLVANENAKPDALITDVKDLTLLDPASGSGHILVVGFDLLMQMYKEEGYLTKQAVREILSRNLFGLDIDKRAAQLARFALLMKAASYEREVLRENILPHIYAMPEAHAFNREDIEEFLNQPVYTGENKNELLKEFTEALHLMQQAQNLGSVMIFNLSEDARAHINACYTHWKKQFAENKLDLNQQAWWLNLEQYLEPLSLLTKQYTCIAANPPYMGQKNMNGELKNYVNENYLKSRSDLFAVFMEVALNLSKPKGLMGMINQHSWMFLSSYEDLRATIIGTTTIENMLHLGPRTFDELSGEVVQSTAFVLCKNWTKNVTGNYFRLVDYKSSEEKHSKFLLRCNLHPDISQANFLKISGHPIAYWISIKTLKLFDSRETLDKISPARIGMMTTDNERFIRNWEEVNLKTIGFKFNDRSNAMESQYKWFPYNKGGSFRKWYGNNELVVNWQFGGREIIETGMNSFRGKDFYFKEGITWSFINSSNFGVRYKPEGFVFDIQGSSSFPSKKYLYYVTAFLNSKLSYFFLTVVNPTLSFQAGNLNALPFIFSEDSLSSIDELAKHCITQTEDEWDNHEYSWDFLQSPLLNQSPTLQIAYDNWLKQASKYFFQLHANEEELNKIFIEIYGLQEEITPAVPLKEITILQDEIDSDALEQLQAPYTNQLVPVKKDVVLQQFFSYAVGCIMGRYRLDKPALHIAHPNATAAEIAPYTFNNHKFEIDEDAIIPLIGSDSPFADNVVNRFKHFVQLIWGEQTLTENINFINACLGMEVEKFLTEKFWAYHKQVYQKKPIYWLFSSAGGSFKVLTYMHRMDKYTVQKIRLNYLHRYIEYLNNELQQADANGGNPRTIDKLNKALDDCREYDKILKPLSDSQITFDLDDGVTVNHAKFAGAIVPLR